MAKENFNDNLLRMLAAEIHFHSALLTAREMYGKSYFALGVGEKASVDQTVFGFVSNNYVTITPEFLAGQTTQAPMGFPVQAAPSTPERS
jgi:hypothetical protein